VKSMIFATAMMGVALSGCDGFMGAMNDGNPNDTAYAGSPGSVYSSADNPSKTIGTVSYDPNTPVPQTDTDMTAPQGTPLPATPPTPKVPAPLR
jgi:hypothetical protein